MRKPRSEIDRAIARLRKETQFPVSELAGEPFAFADGHVVESPSAAQILRWGTQGIRGVFLDVLLCKRRLCWVTSCEAVARFTAGLGAAKAVESAGQPTDQAANLPLDNPQQPWVRGH